MSRLKTRIALVAASVAAPIIVLFLHVRRVYPFIADDSLISLRYAQRLLEGRGLTWTDGERVEGYSNLLWVLLCAAVGALGVDLVTAARLLGCACAVGMLLAVAFAYEPVGLKTVPAPLIGGLCIALSGSVAVWAIGGLEQALLGALLAVGLASTFRWLERRDPHMYTAAGALGLMVWTRPDGILFPMTIAAGLAIGTHLPGVAADGRRGAEGRRAAALIIGTALSLYVIQLLGRRLYYGDWVPNTAHVKLGFSEERYDGGYDWVKWGIEAMWPLAMFVPLLIPFTLWDRKVRAKLAILILPLAAWLQYVCLIGGDIFPGRRHLLAAVVLFAFGAAEFVAAVARIEIPGRTILAAALSAAAVARLAPLQWKDTATNSAIDERWELECKLTAELVGKGFEHERPLAAVDPAGCFPFFSRLPSLDMLGLNDRYIATHPPPPTGPRHNIGHQLGDGKYVLERKPDLVLFCGSAGHPHGCFPSGLEIDQNPRFHAAYHPMTVEATEPFTYRTVLYARMQSPKIGVRVEDGHVIVPGHTFSNAEETMIHGDEKGRLGATCNAEHPARTHPLPLRPGHWHVAIDATAPIARVLVLHGDSLIDEIKANSGTFDFAEFDSPVSIQAECAGSGLVRGATLTVEGDEGPLEAEPVFP